MAEWHGFYTIAQVSRIARIPRRTLYEWRERDIIRPSVQIRNEQDQLVDAGFSYADLTIIKIMRAMREDQLDLKSVGIALAHLFERLGRPSKGWADANVYLVGNRVYADKPDEWEVTAATGFGQKVEVRLFGDMFEELRELEEEAEFLVPERFRPFVQIDPAVMGGEPVVKNTRLPTATLAALKAKGKPVAEIVRLYEPLPKRSIKKAIEFEEYLNLPPSAAGTAAA